MYGFDCLVWPASILAADDELLPYRIAEPTTLAGLEAPPAIQSNPKWMRNNRKID
jgi:hypothetical protein